MGPQDMKVVAPTLREEAVIQLRKGIFEGLLSPGERINEEALSSRLGISRPPLREAFRVLEKEGLIRHNPRRGTFVASLSGSDGVHLAEVRCLLETEALRKSVPLKPEVLLHLARLTQEMDHAARQEDIMELATLDNQFHETLVAQSDNPWIRQAWQSLDGPVRLGMLILLRNKLVGFRETPENHRAIIIALATNRPTVMAAALKRHYVTLTVKSPFPDRPLVELEGASRAGRAGSGTKS